LKDIENDFKAEPLNSSCIAMRELIKIFDMFICLRRRWENHNVPCYMCILMLRARHR